MVPSSSAYPRCARRSHTQESTKSLSSICGPTQQCKRFKSEATNMRYRTSEADPLRRRCSRGSLISFAPHRWHSVYPTSSQKSTVYGLRATDRPRRTFCAAGLRHLGSLRRGSPSLIELLRKCRLEVEERRGTPKVHVSRQSLKCAESST